MQKNQTDHRYLKVKLDDAIIKATDEEGDERLRLSIKVNGHDVLVRFPSKGDWDFYYQDFARLMLSMGLTAHDIEVNGDNVPKKHFSEWAYVMGHSLKYKECKDLVDKIFTEYLRPVVDGLEIKIDPKKEDGELKTEIEIETERRAYVKDWLNMFMDSSHLVYMYQSIIHIEEWYKKKSEAEFKTTLQNLIPPSSKDTSPKNSISKQTDFQPGLPFAFA